MSIGRTEIPVAASREIAPLRRVDPGARANDFQQKSSPDDQPGEERRAKDGTAPAEVDVSPDYFASAHEADSAFYQAAERKAELDSPILDIRV